jgi:hypothetical protein
MLERLINHSKEHKNMIGEGGEYKVYPYTPSDASVGEKVIKVPKFINAVTLYYLYGGVDTLRREIDDFISMAQDKEGVEVAKTDVVQLGGIRHILIQDRIEEDGSVPNIQSYLVESGVEHFALIHRSRPESFRSHEGTVFMVDVTKGPNARLNRKVARALGINEDGAEVIGKEVNIRAKRIVRRIFK